jgi:hypothetical protein
MSRKTTINYDCWWAPVLAKERDQLNTSAFAPFVSLGSDDPALRGGLARFATTVTLL